MCAEYFNRKYKLSPTDAQKLHDEGKVEEAAAELWLPKAQEKMANRCSDDSHGVTKDRQKAVEWAKKASTGGDKDKEEGQFPK